MTDKSRRTPRQARAESTVDAILEATFQLLEAHGVEAFLGEIGMEPEVPDFLADDAIHVVRMVVPPDVEATELMVEDVSKDATHVGLVAFFLGEDVFNPSQK